MATTIMDCLRFVVKSTISVANLALDSREKKGTESVLEEPVLAGIARVVGVGTDPGGVETDPGGVGTNPGGVVITPAGGEIVEAGAGHCDMSAATLQSRANAFALTKSTP